MHDEDKWTVTFSEKGLWNLCMFCFYIIRYDVLLNAVLLLYHNSCQFLRFSALSIIWSQTWWLGQYHVQCCQLKFHQQKSPAIGRLVRVLIMSSPASSQYEPIFCDVSIACKYIVVLYQVIKYRIIPIKRPYPNKRPPIFFSIKNDLHKCPGRLIGIIRYFNLSLQQMNPSNIVCDVIKSAFWFLWGYILYRMCCNLEKTGSKLNTTMGQQETRAYSPGVKGLGSQPCWPW